MQVIDYTAHESLTSHLSQTFSESSNSFQGVFDCVGSDELFRRCSGYLHKDGVFITIVGGVGAGPIARSKLLPVSLGGVPRRYKLLALWPDGAIAKEVAKWVEEGLFSKFPMDSEYSFEDAVKVRGHLSWVRLVGAMSLMFNLFRGMRELLASAREARSLSKSPNRPAPTMGF